MFYSWNNDHIRYIGRFAPNGDAMTATTTGARFLFSFSGEMAVLHFNTNLLAHPFPHLYIKVDDGARVESEVFRYLRITAKPGNHKVEVLLKSEVEQFSRWNNPLQNGMPFLGIEADELLPLPRPRKKKKTMEIVGDSITEGVLINPDCCDFYFENKNRVYQDDVTATYAWLTAEKLGLEPLVMGYGAVGVTKGGCGGVPKAAEAYPYCFAGAPVAYDHPDYVLINHGANDGWASAEVFTEGYVCLLDAVITAHPRAKVICVSPFAGSHEKDLEKLVSDYDERHKKDILFVNASHWIPPEPLHPLRDGHKIVAEKLSEVLKKELNL